jgi:NADH:ubiquinone oxidoreductase subunit 6 (subunit J)
METLIYFCFILLTIVPAIAILFTRQVVNALLLLLLSMVGVAGLFVFMHAEFVGVSQLLIYAGGVTVLVLFGIMLSNKSGFNWQKISYFQIWSGTGLALGFALLLFYTMHTQKKFPLAIKNSNNVKQVGTELLTDFALAFEVTGILLLGVFTGVAVLVGQQNQKHD